MVEANHGDVRLMRELFAEASIVNDLHVVYDGDEALDFLHRRGDHTDAPVPDIVLLDLKLPGGKSEDVLTKLTDESTLADTLVIGMTSTATETDLARSIGIDPDAYIQKPLDPDEFIGVVRDFESFGLSVVQNRSSAAPR